MAGGGPGPSAPRVPLRWLLLLLLLPALPPMPRAAPTGIPREAGPAVSCLAAAPSLSWYLQEEGGGGGGGGEPPAAAAAAAGKSRRRRRGQGTGARRLELPLLNCSATDPETGLPAEASVLLEVHIQPELVHLEEAEEEEEEEEGGARGPEAAVLLVLLVLVEARPPAEITWVDREGRTTVNTSHFLVVEARTYPWPSGQTPLRLRRPPGTPQEEEEEERGGQAADNASLPLLLPGLLAARVELPLLALVSGAAGALLALGSLLSCLLLRKDKKKDAPFLVPPPSDPNHLKPRGPPQMPRANISLPANLRLNDLSASEAKKGQEKRAGDDAPVEEEGERALSEPENSLVLVERGSEGPLGRGLSDTSVTSSLWERDKTGLNPDTCHCNPQPCSGFVLRLTHMLMQQVLLHNTEQRKTCLPKVLAASPWLDTSTEPPV